MNATKRIALVCLIFLTCASELQAQSTVIFNDAAIRQGTQSGTFLTLTNSINPSEGRGGLFAIGISSVGGGQFMLTSWGIAEVYSLFAITAGTVIDSSFVASNTALVSNNGISPGSSVQLFLFGQPRLFGYWDDRPLGGNGTPDINDNYGWVSITGTSLTGLEVSASATAIGGGIIAGTTTPVPEPSSVILLVTGAGLLFLRRIKR